MSLPEIKLNSRVNISLFLEKVNEKVEYFLIYNGAFLLN